MGDDTIWSFIVLMSLVSSKYIPSQYDKEKEYIYSCSKHTKAHGSLGWRQSPSWKNVSVLKRHNLETASWIHIEASLQSMLKEP